MRACTKKWVNIRQWWIRYEDLATKPSLRFCVSWWDKNQNHTTYSTTGSFILYSTLNLYGKLAPAQSTVQLFSLPQHTQIKALLLMFARCVKYDNAREKMRLKSTDFIRTYHQGHVTAGLKWRSEQATPAPKAGESRKPLFIFHLKHILVFLRQNIFNLTQLTR